jgi:hypothetical protein
MLGRILIYRQIKTQQAPAGGAAAVAPERGALACMPVVTYLYLHAVGARSPIAVPGLAR